MGATLLVRGHEGVAAAGDRQRDQAPPAAVLQAASPSCPATLGEYRLNEGFVPEIKPLGGGGDAYSLQCNYGRDNPNLGGSFLTNLARTFVRWAERPPAPTILGLHCGVDTRVAGADGGPWEVRETISSRERAASVIFDSDAANADAARAQALEQLASVEGAAIPCDPEVFCPPPPVGLRLSARPAGISVDPQQSSYNCHYDGAPGGHVPPVLTIDVTWGTAGEYPGSDRILCRSDFPGFSAGSQRDFAERLVDRDRAAALRYSGAGLDQAVARAVAAEILERIAERGVPCGGEAPAEPGEDEENEPPTVRIEPLQAMAGIVVGDALRFRAAADDDGGVDALSYVWTLERLSTGEINSATPTKVEVRWNPKRDGAYRLAVEVADEDGATATAELVVLVGAVSEPQILRLDVSRFTLWRQRTDRYPVDESTGTAFVRRGDWITIEATSRDFIEAVHGLRVRVDGREIAQGAAGPDCVWQELGGAGDVRPRRLFIPAVAPIGELQVEVGATAGAAEPASWALLELGVLFNPYRSAVDDLSVRAGQALPTAEARAYTSGAVDYVFFPGKAAGSIVQTPYSVVPHHPRRARRRPRRAADGASGTARRRGGRGGGDRRVRRLRAHRGPLGRRRRPRRLRRRPRTGEMARNARSLLGLPRPRQQRAGSLRAVLRLRHDDHRAAALARHPRADGHGARLRPRPGAGVGAAHDLGGLPRVGRHPLRKGGWQDEDHDRLVPRSLCGDAGPGHRLRVHPARPARDLELPRME